MPIRIAGFLIDANLREDHSFENEVTDHPVESGSDIADNIRNRPLRVTVDGIISDTPIGAIADARNTAEGFIPSDDIFAELERIHSEREPVDIETSLKVFQSMALERLSIPRDARTGAALRFTASFKQIQIVTNNRLTIRVSVPRAKGKANLGQKQSARVPGSRLPTELTFTPPREKLSVIETGAVEPLGPRDKNGVLLRPDGIRKLERAGPTPPSTKAEDGAKVLARQWGAVI